MKTITILTSGHNPAVFAPMTFLSKAMLTYELGSSTDDGVSGPFYRGSTVLVIPPEWTKSEVEVFAAMRAMIATTVELSDEEADTVIAKLNRNLIGGPAT